MLRDVRFAWRRLIHSPGFAAAAILTLALVRVAIGATPAQVFRTVLGRTSGVLAIGCAIGLASSLLVSRLLTPYLYGASDRDPWALAAVAAVMTCTAALGLWCRPAARSPSIRRSRCERNKT